MTTTLRVAGAKVKGCCKGKKKSDIQIKFGSGWVGPALFLIENRKLENHIFFKYLIIIGLKKWIGGVGVVSFIHKFLNVWKFFNFARPLSHLVFFLTFSFAE